MGKLNDISQHTKCYRMNTTVNLFKERERMDVITYVILMQIYELSVYRKYFLKFISRTLKTSDFYFLRLMTLITFLLHLNTNHLHPFFTFLLLL